MVARQRGAAILECPATVVVDVVAENVGSGRGYRSVSEYWAEAELWWLGVIVVYWCCTRVAQA